MLNKVMIIGRLGKDPEVRYTPSGAMTTSCSMATDETYKDKGGEKVTKTEWHKVVAWGRLAEICAEYLKKGSMVYIEGKIQTQKWKDKDGNDRYTTEIVVAQMKMLSGKSDGESREKVPAEMGPDEVDDVPF